MSSILQRFTNLFPLWVVLAGAVAFAHPAALLWMKGLWITLGLAVIMLGMGLSLRAEDFRRVLQSPRRVITGVVLQYTVMPAAGYAIGVTADLPREFAVGLILVAACPGGTASNVISYLARADLGLSVSMTAVSTLLAAVLTPLLTHWLVGNRMEVSAAKLFWSTAQVVLLPIAIGVLLNRYFEKVSRAIQPFAPPIAVIAIALIVGAVLAYKREAVLAAGFALPLAIMALHAIGFGVGYGLGRLGARDPKAAASGDSPGNAIETSAAERAAVRTISIEVGMQNSGLGVELARTNFPGTLVDVPAAISASVHSIFGSVLAAVWRRSAASAVGEKHSRG